MGATRHLPAVVGAPVAMEFAPQTADTQEPVARSMLLDTWVVWRESA